MIVIPRYNGARRQPNLTPLLAQGLARAGVPVLVHGDPLRLKQLLINLLSNAIKYNRSGGHVQLGWQADGGQVTLQVADTGRGLSAEQLAPFIDALDRVLDLVEAVEAAELSRAPVQKLADRLAGYLVYVAAICAALTWLITRDMRDTISVIIVAGACGIAAGTPIAILGGIGRAARLGAIIKGGIHLETLGRVDTIVLDKTGTLTLNRMQVQRHQAQAGDDAALWTALVLCNDAVRGPQGWVGDPTETALLDAAAQAGVDVPALRAAQPRRHEWPFDADRKRFTNMATASRLLPPREPREVVTQTEWQRAGERRRLNVSPPRRRRRAGRVAAAPRA